MNKRKFRIEIPGSNSVYVDSYESAESIASSVMAANGFGYIHTFGNGPSRLLARFEPFYGVVAV